MAASRQRLFVALWPDAQTRAQIASVQKQAMSANGLLDAAVAIDNLHLTLRFLGDVAAADIESLQARLARVTAMPFHLRLDRWGCFNRPGILWIGPSAPPAPLMRLQSDIAAACRGVSHGGEKKYTPHVTMFRKFDRLPQLETFEPVLWQVDGFVLVASDTRPQGVQYRLLQEVAL